MEDLYDIILMEDKVISRNLGSYQMSFNYSYSNMTGGFVSRNDCLFKEDRLFTLTVI